VRAGAVLRVGAKSGRSIDSRGGRDKAAVPPVGGRGRCGRSDTRRACFDTLTCGQLLSMTAMFFISKQGLHPEQAARAAVSKDD
jgi:hypothetical protein